MTDAPPRAAASLAPAAAVAGDWVQVHLVGFMGAGKSTVGRLLARALVWNFLDLDALVTRHAGASIPELFAAGGEAGFRRHEEFVLRQAVQKPRTVLALGGGTFSAPGNVAVSRASAVSVWLRCSPDIIRARLGPKSSSRPLWDPATAEALLVERSDTYRQADLVVDGDDDPGVVAERVLAALRSRTVGRQRD